LSSAKNKALGKEVFEFFLEISSLPSALTGALRKGISKKSNFFNSYLCRVSNQWALGKDITKKNIETLLNAVSRALGKVIFLKKLPSARSRTLGKENFKKKLNLCRARDLGHSVKIFF